MPLWLIILCLTPACTAKSISSLSDLSWSVSNVELSISVPASFPSHVHLDLFAAGIIEDPYHSLNEFDQRWVARNNWTYNAALQGLQQDAHSTWLLFEGLDTFTTISFCGEHIAYTNNQFRQYHFDVTKTLADCTQDEPILSLNFGSAPKIVDEIARQPGQETWPPYVEQVFEFQNRQFMRKQQSDFGWDWGPAFAPAGPWLPAYVVQLAPSEVHVTNTAIDIYREGQRNNQLPHQSRPWVLNCSVDYFGATVHKPEMKIALSYGRREVMLRQDLANVTMQAGSVSGVAMLDEDMFQDAASMWWPNGLGRQTRHTLNIDISDKSEPEVVASVQKKIGFRTIVLDQEAVSPEDVQTGIAPGDNWHFEINGHVFFAKGSNMIPPNVFWPRVTEHQIRQLFDAVIAANQNMVRLWSSGVYCPDFVYDIADELGILLWSEFEFGDSLYPVDRDFLDNVYEEAVYQVRRLNHHPSLALWAGGNELENLELSLLNRTASEEEYIRYKDEYEQLFLTTLYPAVFENTRSISYTPSSTSNGYISLNFTDPPYFHQRYQSLEEDHIYGETDYYNYDPTFAFNASSYPVGRFSNEFGFHSMPSPQTWLDAIDPSDMHFNSTVVQLRNRHYPPGSNATANFRNTSLGMGEMTRAAQMWFPWPDTKDPVADFSAQCHTTQLFAAAFYTSQIAFYRLGSARPQRTLGALYWQLNDIWQAPTWSSVEYSGRWKVPHYAVARAFAPVIAHCVLDENGMLEAWAISDLWESVEGGFGIDWYDWSGKIVKEIMTTVQVGPLNATLVWRGKILEGLPDMELRDISVRCSARVRGRRPNSETMEELGTVFWMAASSLAESRLVDPGLVLEYETEQAEGDVLLEKGPPPSPELQIPLLPSHHLTNESRAERRCSTSRRFSITATTGVAAWVWLDYPRGAVVEFDDNGFWLAKGQTRRIGFKVVSDTTEGKWKDEVTVRSVWDNMVK